VAIKPCKYGHVGGRDTQSHCLECKRLKESNRRVKNPALARAEDKRYYEANREKRIAQNLAYHLRDPRKTMFRHAKNRARQGGYPFEITIDDINIPEFCPLLGVRLAANTGGVKPSSPSLDKINPELGYVPGNVWVISHRANKIKNDASLAELILLTENLKTRTRTETPITMPFTTFAAPDRMPWQ